MNTKREKMSTIAIAIILAIVSFITIYYEAFYTIDKIVADPWYQKPTAVNKNIKIIAIDEKTVQAYGDMKTWNRDIPARLVNVLTADEAYAPAVIAFDILFVGDVEADSDKAFADACEKAGNVVTAVNVVHRTKIEKGQDNTLLRDKDHVEMVEYPYDDLKRVTYCGVTNTIQDADGYIRYARLATRTDTEEIPSLAYAIYQLYAEKNDINLTLPKMMDKKVFGFTYSGKSGAYEILSMSDVLEGRIDQRAFANSIVLVGAYAPGMQDAYNVAVQRGTQMYGVEIHANILEALMEHKTAVPVSDLWFAWIAVVIILGYYFACTKMKLLPTTIAMLLLITANMLVGRALYQSGYIMALIDIPVFVILVYIYQLAQNYLLESLHRRKVVSAFKKYVAPQVVEEISKQGDFKIVLGGENRHVAVLFVDIRGFTPMSESLEPEQVVEILNEYLTLTTNSIFKNGGTLDKFIGDATMAVFNAPFDLDDYIYKAVCTARDIAAGSAMLEEKLMERFGKKVSFGIGVNCGNAVVGNIGCEFRMDYTAIGDTVNTAARLESNAKAGQILISEDVYNAVKDRVKVSEVGEIPLKGKQKGVFVYSVDEVL